MDFDSLHPMELLSRHFGAIFRSNKGKHIVPFVTVTFKKPLLAADLAAIKNDLKLEKWTFYKHAKRKKLSYVSKIILPTNK